MNKHFEEKLNAFMANHDLGEMQSQLGSLIYTVFSLADTYQYSMEVVKDLHNFGELLDVMQWYNINNHKN